MTDTKKGTSLRKQMAAEGRKAATAAMAKYRSKHVPVSCVMHTERQAEVLKAIAMLMRNKDGEEGLFTRFLETCLESWSSASPSAAKTIPRPGETARELRARAELQAELAAFATF